jgi:hypothetical protein
MAVSSVSGDAGKRREIASGEPDSGDDAGNQTPFAYTSWAWLVQKREPNAPEVVGQILGKHRKLRHVQLRIAWPFVIILGQPPEIILLYSLLKQRPVRGNQ